MAKNTLRGEGPWEFEIPELAPGESHYLDFRNMTHRGRPGYFRAFLPLDDAQVTNTDDSAAVSVEINHEYGGRVQPNTERPFPEAGVEYLTITNAGTTTISAGNVIAEVASSSYGADQAARERKGKPLAARMISDLVPGL